MYEMNFIKITDNFMLYGVAIIHSFAYIYYILADLYTIRGNIGPI